MSAIAKKPVPWKWSQLLIAIVVVAVLVYDLAPGTDLRVSGWFWRTGDGFWLNRVAAIDFVYRYTKFWTLGFSVLLLAALGWTAATGRDLYGATRNRLAVAALALALGPGLLAHQGFKDHWGRPRPSQIEAFGGSGPYVPPWQPTTRCDRNCSFVSGHAAAGTLLMAGALVWPLQRRRWLLAGALLGAAIGAVRVAQGGHFVSDVAGSLALTWLVLLGAEKLALRLGWIAPPAPPGTPRKP